MPKLKTHIPKLSKHHKGYAFVKVDGRQIWLGVYGEADTLEAYNRLIAAWLANGRKLPSFAPETSSDATVSVLIRDYLKHCESIHSKPNTGRISNAMKPLRRLFGSVPAEFFKPKDLELVRSTWVEEKLTRNHINEKTNAIRRMFKWAAAHEMVPASTWKALEAVENLRHGQGGRESSAVRAVEQSRIDAVQSHVSRQVWALIQLQLLTGARGGELFGVRLADLDMSGEVWDFRLTAHKTSHKGKERTIHFGPKAQEVIKQFMPRPLHVPLFSPREALVERKRMGAKGKRRPNQKPNPRKTDRTVGDTYDKDSYRIAIRRGCKAAGVKPWNPHQLRHTFATNIRRSHGLEASRVLLGHSDLAVTQVYAEADEAKAIEVICRVG